MDATLQCVLRKTRDFQALPDNFDEYNVGNILPGNNVLLYKLENTFL